MGTVAAKNRRVMKQGNKQALTKHTRGFTNATAKIKSHSDKSTIKSLVVLSLIVRHASAQKLCCNEYLANRYTYVPDYFKYNQLFALFHIQKYIVLQPREKSPSFFFYVILTLAYLNLRIYIQSAIARQLSHTHFFSLKHFKMCELMQEHIPHINFTYL